MTGYPVTPEERERLRKDAAAVRERFGFTPGVRKTLKKAQRKRWKRLRKEQGRCWWCGR